MESPILRIVLIFLSFATFSCSDSGRQVNTLPPLKIDIPVELKGNPEVVAFIKDSEEAINLYTQSGEELAAKIRPYVGKKEEEIGMLDKMKMLAAFGEFTAHFSQAALKYGEMAEKTKVFEEGLTEEQMAALATVLESFKNRMAQLEAKYKDINIQN